MTRLGVDKVNAQGYLVFNSLCAIRYFWGVLARYILRAPKYHKTRSVRYFGPLFLEP